MSLKHWIVAGSLAALTATPPARSVVKGGLLLTEVLPSPVRPLETITRDPTVERIRLGGAPADLYVPAGPPAPGVVLVHGANPGGIDDPRVRRVGSGVARLGRTVLAPSLALADRRFDPADTERIRAAISDLARRTGGPVVVLAFSYGAAYALVALEERPEIQPRVRALATVGTYFDLVHLVQGLTTGTVEARGRRHPWSPPAGAGEIVTAFFGQFLPAADGAALVEAYRARDPAGLSPEARAVYDLMTNDDPRRTRALVDASPEPIRRLIEDYSPSRRIERIRIAVHALHSRQDPATPSIESVELVEALRPHTEAHLTVVGSLRHVTPTGNALQRMRDVPALAGFAAAIIRPQEPLLPRVLCGRC